MSAEPAISVIIPARDSAPTLQRTLESLRAQQLGEPFEVIVVDDGSEDETAELVQGYSSFARVIRNERSEGPGAARNRGVAAARGRVLAFTDADCFPTGRWLAQGLEALASADLVQGRVAPDPSVARTPFDRTLSVDGDGGFYQTANLLMRGEVFDAVGGFRDWALERDGRRRWSADTRRGRASRTPIGEDTHFAWRARRLGARSIFASDAVVHHAVVPGGLLDELGDRWHWASDMPGLVRLVPELRRAVLYQRWFFAPWSAEFDMAVAAVALAAISRKRVCLLAAVPYLARLRREGGARGLRRTAKPDDLRRAITFAVGSVVVDAATLAGFIAGSIAWRSLVL